MAGTPRKPGDSLPPVKKSRTAEAVGGENAERPVAAGVYEGRVTARQGDGTYLVTLTKPMIDLTGVRLGLALFGGLLGVAVRSHLPHGTRVEIAYGSPSFIIAILPEINPDWLNAKNRSLVNGDEMDAESGVMGDNFSATAEDMLEGEVEISNLHGVALDFLTTIMRLRAGDRAAVECHLINDMVRVISSQYRHISGLGEDLIFDHGRPTMERTWSSYRHEVLGQVKEKEPLVEMNGDEADATALEAKRITGLGRSRFREFVGYAGDFIHSFISDPPATAVSMAKGSAAAGAGKSWIHRNSDGSVIVQSVADIRIERVVRIPVAVRSEPHEGPELTAKRAYDQLNGDYLKLPTAISPVEPTDAFQMAYHIRTYSRWLGRYHSFARMLQLNDKNEGEYDIPSEAASPKPDYNNLEEDRADVNPRVDYIDTYACMSILRDGSIVHHDGYGSTILMSNGNVQISASRHLDLEAAGDIRMLAGGSILMKARRNIELSARLGGLILHSYAWVKVLCERGSLFLRSNAKTDKDVAPEAKEESGILPEIAGRVQGSEDGFAVLVEASEGAAAYRSDKGTTVAVDGNHPLIVSTEGDLDLYGSDAAVLHSRRNVGISGGLDIALGAQAVMTNANKFVIGSIGNPSVVIQNRKLWAHTIEAENLRGNNIKGKETGPRHPIPDPDPTNPVKTHYNHIDTLKNPIEEPQGLSARQDELLKAAISLAQATPVIPWSSSFEGPKWAFPNKAEYMWDERDGPFASSVPETLTQQYLRLDAMAFPDQWGGPGYDDWSIKNTLEGKRTISAGGFGSYESQMQANDAGEPLRTPSATLAKDTLPVDATWRPKADFVIKALKRFP